MRTAPDAQPGRGSRTLLLCVLAGCSSSTFTAPGTSTDASKDGAVEAAPGDATTETGAGGDAAVNPCGPLTATWTRCAANPLEVAGAEQPNGTYALSIGDPDVQYDAWDQTWRAWWSTGYSSTYPAANPLMTVMYATSKDGVTWSEQPTPVLESQQSTSDWDYSDTETPSVIYLPNNPTDRRWLMYYSGGNKLVKTAPGGNVWYQIGLAFSADGTNFTRLPADESPYAGQQTPYANVAGLLLLAKDAFPGLPNVADGMVADPEIVQDDAGTLHLFFSSYAVDSMGNTLAYGISHATSQDGVHFTQQANNPIAAINYSAGPSVYRTMDGTWELYFYLDSTTDRAMIPSTFNPELGEWRATSTDLMNWTPPGSTRDIEWDGSYPYEAYGWIATGDMAFGAPEHRWYYVAFSSQNPPSGWTVPTHTGNVPAVIALSMAQRE
jgi:hypothetical protein